MLFAAQSGDSEAIRDLIRRGVDIDQADYDGRSALAMVGVLNQRHTAAAGQHTHLLMPVCVVTLYPLLENMLKHIGGCVFVCKFFEI